MKSSLKNFLSLAIALLVCSFNVNAQEAEVSDSLKEVLRSGEAQFYTFNYPSKSVTGEDVVLSSLLVAWMPTKPATTDSIESLHIYSHYTITSDKECPSSSSNSIERLLFGVLAKKSYGMGFSNPDYSFISRCVIIAPDYEGYGVTRDRSHPYLSQELTAQQVLDGVNYGMALYQKHINDKRALDFKSNWRSFSYGFSQGGAVALAVHKYIEQNDLSDELRFKGSICGDGPYDLVATLRYYMDDDGYSYDTQTTHVKGTSTMPMVMPMIIKAALDTYPYMKEHAMEDYFSQQFLDTGIMDWLASKQYSTGDIEKLWYQQMQSGFTANGRHYTPEQMAEMFYSPSKNSVWSHFNKTFTPGFYEYVANLENFDTVPPETGDVWQDMHRALIDNSVCAGWEPWHRIQFVHSKGDMVVPFGNYLSFRNAHPDGEGELFRLDDSVSPQDHTSAGTQFFWSLAAYGTYGEYFKWLDEGEYTTGIESMANGQWTEDNSSLFTLHSSLPGWYTLDGRRLNGRPTAKGIYVYNGKKIAIK
jgi:hypothetical protein